MPCGFNGWDQIWAQETRGKREMGSFVYLTYREEFRRYVCVQLAMMDTGRALESYTKGLLEKISGDKSVQCLQPCTKGCSQQLLKHNRAKYVQCTAVDVSISFVFILFVRLSLLFLSDFVLLLFVCLCLFVLYIWNVCWFILFYVHVCFRLKLLHM